MKKWLQNITLGGLITITYHVGYFDYFSVLFQGIIIITKSLIVLVGFAALSICCFIYRYLILKKEVNLKSQSTEDVYNLWLLRYFDIINKILPASSLIIINFKALPINTVLTLLIGVGIFFSIVLSKSFINFIFNLWVYINNMILSVDDFCAGICKIGNVGDRENVDKNSVISVKNILLNRHIRYSYKSPSHLRVRHSLNTTPSCFRPLSTKNEDSRISSPVSSSNTEKYLLNSRFALAIASILNKDITDLKMQEAIEKFMSDNVHCNLINDLKSDTLKWNSLPILLKIIKSCSEAIDEWKVNKLMLNKKVYKTALINSDNNVILSVVLSNILSLVFKSDSVTNQKVTSVVNKIGKLLVYHYNMSMYIDYKHYCLSLLTEYDEKIKDLSDINKHKDILNKLLLNKPYKFIENDGIFNTIHNEIFIKDADITFNYFSGMLHTFSFGEDEWSIYGLDAVEFIANHSDLYYIDHVDDDFEDISKRVIVISDNMKKEIIDLLFIDDNNFPMIRKPNSWDVDIYNNNDYKITNIGGYLSHYKSDKGFIHNKFKNQGRVKLYNPNIINTINYLQNVPYKINQEVLNIIIESLDKGILSSKLYVKPHKDSKNMRLMLKGCDYLNVNRILKYNSLALVNNSILTKALLLKDKSIYFPIFIDWRGRIYCETSSFSYQGPDLAKSLFLFKRGGVILNENGVKRLKLYIAQLYGEAKKMSNIKMLEWVDLNIDKIIDIKNNFWINGKEPFRCLAASIEMRDYLLNPKTFISYLPIYIDGTCNGLQHLSTMAADTNLASYVNIKKSSDEDIPNDLYKKMADIVKVNIDKLVTDDPHYAIFNIINIDRAFVKRGIMTIPYGVTSRGVTKQLLSEQFIKSGRNKYQLVPKYSNSPENTVEFNYKEVNVIADMIHSVLFKSHPLITNLVNYFYDINRFLYKINTHIAIFWKTPSGLLIEQRYVIPEEKVIRTTILGRRKSVTLHKYSAKYEINIKKQNTSIIPNIIHSLDASNISLLVNSIISEKKDINLLTIHDAFATNANFIDELSFKIKEAFIIIYGKQDFVKRFHEDIMKFISEQGFIIRSKNNVNYIEVTLDSGKIRKLKVPKIFKVDEFDLKSELILSKYFMH